MIDLTIRLLISFFLLVVSVAANGLYGSSGYASPHWNQPLDFNRPIASPSPVISEGCLPLPKVSLSRRGFFNWGQEEEDDEKHVPGPTISRNIMRNPFFSSIITKPENQILVDPNESSRPLFRRSTSSNDSPDNDEHVPGPVPFYIQKYVNPFYATMIIQPGLKLRVTPKPSDSISDSSTSSHFFSPNWMYFNPYQMYSRSRRSATRKKFVPRVRADALFGVNPNNVATNVGPGEARKSEKYKKLNPKLRELLSFKNYQNL